MTRPPRRTPYPSEFGGCSDASRGLESALEHTISGRIAGPGSGARSHPVARARAGSPGGCGGRCRGRFEGWFERSFGGGSEPPMGTRSWRTVCSSSSARAAGSASSTGRRSRPPRSWVRASSWAAFLGTPRSDTAPLDAGPAGLPLLGARLVDAAIVDAAILGIGLLDIALLDIELPGVGLAGIAGSARPSRVQSTARPPVRRPGSDPDRAHATARIRTPNRAWHAERPLAHHRGERTGVPFGLGVARRDRRRRTLVGGRRRTSMRVRRCAYIDARSVSARPAPTRRGGRSRGSRRPSACLP